MPTLLLSPRYTPDSIALWKAAIAAGWEVTRLSSWRPPEGFTAVDPVLCDEPLFALMMAEALSLALLEPTLDWLPRLPLAYRRREVAALTLAEARALRAPTFVKPADDKCFPARVYASGAELPVLAHLPADTPALAAEPVVWEREFRAFVAERRVLTLSIYLRGGELGKTDDGDWPASDEELASARAFLEAMLDDPAVAVPPAAVIDVGVIRDRGWAVVESNPAWGSGICGCDPHRVLPVLARACRSRSELTRADSAWLVTRG